MAQNLSNFDAGLRDIAAPYIVSQLQYKTVALDLVQDGESEIADGRRAQITLHLRQNWQGVKSTPEGRRLPSAGQMGYAAMTIPYVDTTGRIQLSVQVIDQSENNRSAWVNALMEEMDGLIRVMAQYRNQQMCGYGSGILGRVNADPAANAVTINVKDPGGITGTVNGSRFFRSGMVIAGIRSGAIVSNGVVTVTGVPDSNNITIASNTADFAPGDEFVPAADLTVSATEDTDWYAPIMGLPGLVDDGTFINTIFGLSRSTYPVLQSRVVPNAGAFSGDLIQRELDVAEQRGDGDIKVHLMHHSTRRVYVAILEQDRRYTGADLRRPDLGTNAAKVAKGGHLTFADVPIREEKYFPYGMWMGLDTDNFLRFVKVEGRWEDRQGSILQLDTAGNTHQFTALFYMRDNFAHTRPNSCFRIDGLTTSVVALNLE